MRLPGLRTSPLGRLLVDGWVPNVLHCELSYGCNHRCPFCLNPTGPLRGDVIGAGEWLEAIGAFVDLGVREVTFSGGEPLCHPDFKWILGEGVKALRAVGGKVSVMTNGALVDDDWVRYFAELGVAVSVSVVGLENMGALTGSSTSLAWIESRVRTLLDAGVVVMVTMPVSVLNLPDLGALMRRVGNWGVALLFVAPLMPSGRCGEHPELLLDDVGFAEMVRVVEDYRRSHRGLEVVLSRERVCGCLGGDGRYLWQPDCGAGVDNFVLGPDGWVRPCVHNPQGFFPWRVYATACQRVNE